MSKPIGLLSALALLFSTPSNAQTARETIAIVGADVLPMTSTERLSDQTVILRGDRIETVGPSARVRVPPGARRIEARGMTLMPGLVDMHVHLAPTPGEPGDAAQRAMAVMLAHGVTTARSMAGSPDNLAVRDKVERGVLAGPRLYAASPPINVHSAPTEEAAREAVRAARAAGYDLIKAHHLPDAPVWEAMQQEARAQGMPVAGHVTNNVGLGHAMLAGQQIEHLDGALFILVPDGGPEGTMEFDQIPPPPVVLAASRVNDAVVQNLAQRVAVSRSWQVPTLALFERVLDVAPETAALRSRPDMRYVPEPVLGQWAQQREGLRNSGYPPAILLELRDLRRRIVRAFHSAGVRLMAGSDTAQAFHVWGPGLIDEIEALHAAGLNRIEALRSATVVPRDYFRSLPNGGSALGRRADFGTVERGARADLILLTGDPTADLSLLRRPAYVIAAGRVHDRAELDRMLDEAAAAARRTDR